MRRPRTSFLVRVALTPVVVLALYLLKANVWFRLYPAVMAAFALGVFAISLFRTPLVETIARGMGEDLDEKGVAYCRTMTRVWTVFLSAHLAVTIATVFASQEIWAIYNGCIAYVLMGILFAGEWLVRRRIRRG